jgi:hypothetical protein
MEKTRFRGGRISDGNKKREKKKKKKKEEEEFT